MTDEQLHQLIERDNLARIAVSTIELLGQVKPDRHERLHREVRNHVAAHEMLSEDHGVDPLPRKPRKVAGEPEDLPDDILAAYRALKRRIREAEHITLSPTAIHCAADVPA